MQECPNVLHYSRLAIVHEGIHDYLSLIRTPELWCCPPKVPFAVAPFPTCSELQTALEAAKEEKLIEYRLIEGDDIARGCSGSRYAFPSSLQSFFLHSCEIVTAILAVLDDDFCEVFVFMLSWIEGHLEGF